MKVYTERGMTRMRHMKGFAIAKRHLKYLDIPENATHYRIEQICEDYAVDEMECNFTAKEKAAVEETAFIDAQTATYMQSLIATHMRDLVFKKRGLKPMMASEIWGEK